MNNKDSLGDRIKKTEQVYNITLPYRMPVIIRLDGKAFHSYTRGCKRPFDEKLSNAMIETSKVLCKEIQGAQIAYTQSDEISILIHNYKRFHSQSWFDNQIQKMVSVSASIAGATFTSLSAEIFSHIKPAYFDSRAFILPESEVCNYFIWRSQDNTRNSIQMLARSLYSHKECNNKNCNKLQEMCFNKGQNWNDLENRWKRGVCIIKKQNDKGRSFWDTDFNIPIFSEDRNYINTLLKVEEE